MAFLALVSARHNEIHGHHQGVFKAGLPIQSAVSAAEMVVFQNLQAFGQVYPGCLLLKGHDIEGMVDLHPPAEDHTDKQKTQCRISLEPCVQPHKSQPGRYWPCELFLSLFQNLSALLQSIG